MVGLAGRFGVLGRRFIYKGAEYTYRRGSLGRLEVWNTIFKVWVGFDRGLCWGDFWRAEGVKKCTYDCKKVACDFWKG